MVEIITGIIDLLIIAGVVFAVLFIRKRLKQHPWRRYMLIAFFILFGIIIVASSATVIYSTKNLPKDYKTRISSKIIIPPYDILKTPISMTYAEELKNNPTKSGAMLIKSGKVSFLHRIALVRMARHSIELQTYIYENDITSRILMHEMKLAADRGVKVRILVDDNGLSSDTSDIMLLNYHPNIQVKVFNPYEYRSKILKYPQFIFNISRLNYRMHNKLFIVDSSAVIIGGRNIASNYFDDSSRLNFSDTDVLFIGKLAQDALGSFDEYWNYHKSIPVDVFPNLNNPEELEILDREITAKSAYYQQEKEMFDAAIKFFLESFNEKKFPVYWGNSKLIADSPEKAEGGNFVSPIIGALDGLWLEAKKSVYISAAYFVPGKNGTQNLINSAKNGININILTNSLASTDAKVVYSGWDRYRDDLVLSGINVYEFRNEGYKVYNRHNSGASLHSKTIVVDDKISWIGSFNLDGRSAIYNTEVIAAFFNEDFAKLLRESMEKDMSEYISWKLYAKNNKVYWKTYRNGKEIVKGHIPDTSLLMRIVTFILKIVPEKLI